ncbi:MAG TPA: FtsX-like permease family protein [Streptosporangiaceae bacterium]|nr:FtsX-like permease family protein [Streptosporangiaceae bacterium]
MRQTARTAGSVAALAVLVCACVFAALTGPAVSLRTRTQALSQTLAAASPTTKSVQLDADWAQFTAYLNTNQGFEGIGVSTNLTPSQFAQTQREIGRGLARLPLPLGAGAWAGLASHLLPVAAGAGPLAFIGVESPPMMEVVYRNTLPANAQLVAGSYAHGAPPRGGLAGAVTTQMAARFGLHPGSRVVLNTPTGPVRIVITAIVRIRGPDSSFWGKDSTVGLPSLITGKDTCNCWGGSIFADPDQIVAMENEIGSSSIDIQWVYPLAVGGVGGVGADGAPALLADLNRASAVPPGLTGPFAPAAGVTAVAAPLVPILSAFLTTQAAVQTVLLLLFVSLIVVGAAVILLAAGMLAVRRADDLGLLRSRGASVRQVAALMLRSTAIVAMLAAAAGAGLAVAVAGSSDASSALGLSLACITVVTALAGPPLIAAWQHRRPRSGPAGSSRVYPGREERPRSRGAGLRRLVAEVTAVAASAAGLVVLHHQGVPANGGINLYLAATPVLLAIPVVLVVLRLYPLAIQGLLRLSSRRAGATGFVALAGAARSSLTGVLPAFALVLALSLAAFAGMVSQAITRGEVAASWQATGADVAITATSSPITPGAEKAIGSVPGVRHLTATWNTAWTTPNGQPVTLVAVDPASYAALIASTPFPAVPLAKLGTGSGSAVTSTQTVPVLASPAAAASLGGTTAQLSPPLAIGPIRVRVAGTVTSIPGQPSGSAFLVMLIQRLPGPLGVPAVNRILITGSGISTAAMSAVILRQLPGASSAFRSDALAALADSPLQHGADLILPLTIATAAGFGLFILMLGVALGTSDRALTLARLTVMGHERATRLILLEALPAVVAAVAAGAACALALPPLVGSALDLSVFTGQGVPVMVRPDWISLGLPAVAVLLLAAAALVTQARRLSRRGMARILRAE